MKNVENGFAERLLELLHERKIRRRELAAIVGVTPANVGFWLQGQGISADRLVKVAAALGVQPSWLATGQGSREASVDDAGYICVPEYGWAVGAGAQPLPFDSDHDVNVLCYHRRFFESRGLDLHQCIVVTAAGDSMEPLIYSGDKLLVDRSRTQPGAENAIYVFSDEQSLRVKFLRCRTDRALVIHSANPVYTDEIVPAESAETALRVLGRVVDVHHLFM